MQAFHSGFRNPKFSSRLSSSAVLSLSQQVAALLAGTTGFALDPTDATTLWQDSAKTTPVTAASQPVGAIRTKWGLTQFDLIQATASNRPAWNGVAALSFDGAGDTLQTTEELALTNSALGLFLCTYQDFSDSGSFFRIQTSNPAVTRLSLGINGNGDQNSSSRSADDVAQTVTAVTGSVFGKAVRSAVWNYSTGALSLRSAGLQIHAATLTGFLGALPNEPSLGVFWTPSSRSGLSGRTVFCPFVPTAPQLAAIEAWVGEVLI